MGLVIDASVAVAWLMPDEQDNRPLDLLVRASQDDTVVPAHWQSEVANALIIGERRKRITASQTAVFVEQIACLDVKVDVATIDDIFGRIMPLARAHGLTVYDAIYLELAERRGLPLATLDQQLRKAAQAVGVEQLP